MYVKHTLSLYIRTVSVRVLMKAHNVCLHNVCFYGKLWEIIPKFSLPPFLIYSIVDLLFYVHGKHLRSCREGQLT